MLIAQLDIGGDGWSLHHSVLFKSLSPRSHPNLIAPFTFAAAQVMSNFGMNAIPVTAGHA